MTQVRVKGYVVGYDEANGAILWSVKVKDPQSIHNGEKFIVAWCSEGTMLTKPAVDVTFKIEPVQVGREKVLRAVDVQFFGQTRVGSNQRKLPEVRETLNLMVTEMNGRQNVYVTGCDTQKEAASNLVAAGSEDERVTDFIAFDIYEHVTEGDDAEIPGAFEVIKAVAYVDHGMQALEKFLTAVYLMGRNSQS